jgi:hypothetical protein
MPSNLVGKMFDALKDDVAVIKDDLDNSRLN